MAEVKADEQVRGRSPQAVLGCPWCVVVGKPGNRLGVPARAGRAPLCAASPPRSPGYPGPVGTSREELGGVGTGWERGRVAFHKEPLVASSLGRRNTSPGGDQDTVHLH